MMRRLLISAIAMLGAACTQAATQDTVTYYSKDGVDFSPEKGVHANLALRDTGVALVINDGGASKPVTIDWETETSLRVSVADFNFDGRPDFAVSQLDWGMGTYHIYRIFLYDRRKRDFTELRPRCGAEFINVRLSGRTLVNHYVVDHVWKACRMTFGR